MPVKTILRRCNRGGAPEAAPRPRLGLGEVTAIMTVFRRPRCSERQVESLRRYYPELPLLIGDNGDQPPTIDDAHARVLTLPFDCGISAARNALVREVQTDLVLLLDDDYLWTDETRIERFLDVLESDPEVGAVGGWWHDRLPGETLPVAWAMDLEVFRGRLIGHVTDHKPRHIAQGGTSYRYADTIQNFALYRREVLRECPWDEDLKVQEHWDHLLRLKRLGRWRCAYTDEVAIVHDRQARPSDYKEYRDRRSGAYQAQAMDKWGIAARDVPDWRANARRPRGLPNLIVLTPGHTGSSIVTHLLHRLGWRAPEDVDRFAEPPRIRRLNKTLLWTGRFDERAARQALQALPQPWAIKDPRFSETLPRWLPLLASYAPAMLFLDRDVAQIRVSRARRNEPVTLADDWRAKCATLHARWPWAKHRIDFDALRECLQAFDASRVGAGKDGYGDG